MIKLKYFKQMHITAKERSAVKYLSQSVSYLSLYYTALVLPFMHFLEINYDLRTQQPSALLFSFRRKSLSTDALSSVMRHYSQRVLGQKFSVALYRHLSLSFVRYFMFEDLSDFTHEDSNNVNEIIAAQMHHSVQTDQLHYAKLSNSLVNVRVDKQQQYLQFSLRYHQFFKLHTIVLSYSSYTSTSDNVSIRQRALQSSLSADTTQALKYFNKKHQRAISDTSLINTHNEKRVKLSDLQKQLFSDMQSNKNSQSQFTVTDCDSLHTVDVRRRIEPEDVSDSLLICLRQFLNINDAQFTCTEQRRAVELILKKVNCLTVILGTGQGKSLLYLFTASFSNSECTVVIVPLTALKLDLLKRCQQFSVSASIYEDSKKADSLIFVSVETAVTADFQFFLKDLQSQQKLDRIVFDECHLIITAASYRYHMHLLKQLRLINTQFIFLSATLSAKLQKDLEEHIMIQQNTVIRAQTVRHNISYRVSYFESMREESQFSELQSTLISFIKTFSAQDRVLIYMMSKASAERLRTFLNCAIYHSDSTHKSETLSDFIAGKELILVTTSALSVGFDYSSIRLVVHFLSSFSLIDFIQESGRAGRDSTNAVALTFTTASQCKVYQSDNEERRYFKEYLSESVCRRRVINRVLNNIITDECLTSQALCDLCSARQIQREYEIAQYKMFVQNNEQQKQQLVQFLNEAQCVCTFCYISLQSESSSFTEHHFKQCSQKRMSYFVIEALQQIKSALVLREGSYYFHCYLPVSVCKQTKKSDSDRCTYKYLVLCIVYAAYDMRDRYQLSTLIDADILHDRAKFLKYICQYKRVFDTDSITAIELLLYIQKKRHELKESL